MPGRRSESVAVVQLKLLVGHRRPTPPSAWRANDPTCSILKVENQRSRALPNCGSKFRRDGAAEDGRNAEHQRLELKLPQPLGHQAGFQPSGSWKRECRTSKALMTILEQPGEARTRRRSVAKKRTEVCRRGGSVEAPSSAITPSAIVARPARRRRFSIGWPTDRNRENLPQLGKIQHVNEGRKAVAQPLAIHIRQQQVVVECWRRRNRHRDVVLSDRGHRRRALRSSKYVRAV